MILHGKDLIVSIDGNSMLASKSCALSVSAKTITKTSPTSGDWEEVLSGKKSWSLSTNHLVKPATAQTVELSDLQDNFYFSNKTGEGWVARGNAQRIYPYRSFDEVGVSEGIYLLEIDPAVVFRKKTLFNRNGIYNGVSLEDYLSGDEAIEGSTIDDTCMIVLMPVGDFVLNSDVCNILEITYHVALPCIQFGNSPVMGNKTYDNSPIIIVGGKTLSYGYASLNSINNEMNFALYDGVQVPKNDGILGAIEMVGETVSLRMTDNNGSVWMGQAIVTKFDVTGSKVNLMTGAFAFKGNSLLQINKKEYDVEPVMPAKYVDRIIIDMNKSNPAEMITGDINGSVLQDILKYFHRYLCKYQGNGVMAMCQLSDDASTIFYDGTVAILDGTMGDVYVGCEIFENTDLYVGFYFGIENLGDGRYVVSISRRSFNGSAYWSNKNLIGAFRAQGTTSYNNNVAGEAGGTYYLRSIAAERSAFKDTPLNLSRAKERMNTSYFGLVGPDDHAIVALLYFMKFGNTNSKARCGMGGAAESMTGVTVPIGMEITNAISGSGNVNIFGLEDWWNADDGEYMDRMAYQNGKILTMPWGGVWDAGTEASGNSRVIGKMLMQADPLIMIPQGAQPMSYDYNTHFCSAFFTQTQGPMLRGFGLESGGLCALSVGSDAANATTRLCFRGSDVQIIENVSTFTNNVYTPIVNPAN